MLGGFVKKRKFRNSDYFVTQIKEKVYYLGIQTMMKYVGKIG